MMSTTTILLVVGVVALGLCVIRFGLAMKNLEQRVSDLQERIDRAPSV